MAEGGIHCLIARHDHQPGGAEIQTVDQSTAGEDLHQTVVHRIDIVRIFPRQAQQPAGLIDQHQMVILKEDLNVVMAGWSNKVINNGRHQAARSESGGREHPG